MTFFCHVGVATGSLANLPMLVCWSVMRLGGNRKRLPTSTLYLRDPASPSRTCILPGEHSTRCLIAAVVLGIFDVDRCRTNTSREIDRRSATSISVSIS